MRYELHVAKIDNPTLATCPDKKKLVKTHDKCMSNELATHLTCVLNAFDVHFSALKTFV